MKGADLDSLREAQRRLCREPIAGAAAQWLEARAEALNQELSAAVLEAIPAFSRSGNPEVLPAMAGHAAEHTREIARLLAGGRPGGFDFVRAHARRRAEQRFPLEATLHAYRCGHRVYSRWIRQAVEAASDTPDAVTRMMADITDFAIEYTDAISTLAAAEYVARTRLLADVAGDERAALMSILLDGHDESDGRVERVLRDAGFVGQRLACCVVAARPVSPGEMHNPARARRLADAVGELLARCVPRRLVDVRDHRVVAVACEVRRQSGWTAPRASLARRVAAELRGAGNAVLIGVSNDAPSTAHVPRAWREARFALDLAAPERRVVQFSDIGLRERLLEARRDELLGMLPAWAEALFAADDRAQGVLVETLRRFAEADMNVLAAARALGAHPNTVYARMERIEQITGLAPRSFRGLGELLLAADCRPRGLALRRDPCTGAGASGQRAPGLREACLRSLPREALALSRDRRAPQPERFFAAQGLQGLQTPRFGAHGLQGFAGFFAAQGLKPFWTSSVYAVSAARSRESQGRGSACMGTTMQNCTISSACTCSTPAICLGIWTGCG